MIASTASQDLQLDAEPIDLLVAGYHRRLLLGGHLALCHDVHTQAHAVRPLALQLRAELVLVQAREAFRHKKQRAEERSTDSRDLFRRPSEGLPQEVETRNQTSNRCGM